MRRRSNRFRGRFIRTSKQITLYQIMGICLTIIIALMTCAGSILFLCTR
jgi:hypothetical protein